MNTNDMLAKIEAKRNQLDTEAAAQRNTEAISRKKLEAEIMELWERIENIIEVGNALKKNGFLYNKETIQYHHEDARLKPYGYEGAVIAEGIHHHVGFMVDRTNYMDYFYSPAPIEYLGIRMGGACGDYDFYTNGMSICSVHEKDGRKQSVPIKHMEKFLREFPQFESAFYAWVEAIIK